jgi:hypothetical protein
VECLGEGVCQCWWVWEGRVRMERREALYRRGAGEKERVWGVGSDSQRMHAAALAREQARAFKPHLASAPCPSSARVGP